MLWTLLSDSIFCKATRATVWTNLKVITNQQDKKNVYEQVQKDSILRIYAQWPLCNSQTSSLFRSFYTEIIIQNTTITLILSSCHSFTLTKACCFRGPQRPLTLHCCINQEAFSAEATSFFSDSRLMLTCELSPDSSCFCWLSVFFAVKRPPHPLALFSACKWRDSCK